MSTSNLDLLHRTHPRSQKANRLHIDKNSSPHPKNQSQVHVFLRRSDTLKEQPRLPNIPVTGRNMSISPTWRTRTPEIELFPSLKSTKTCVLVTLIRSMVLLTGLMLNQARVQSSSYHTEQVHSSTSSSTRMWTR